MNGFGDGMYLYVCKGAIFNESWASVMLRCVPYSIAAVSYGRKLLTL